MKRILITDLDNTIYNFIDYFAPCFRGMIHALSRELKLDEDLLTHDFKVVFNKHGSLEYAFAIQELTATSTMSSDEIKRLIAIGKGAFSRVRQKNLEPYPHVKETLEWLSQQGIIIIAVSNAPYFHALRRLRVLKLERFYSGILCWEGAEIPYNEYSKPFIEKLEAGNYKSTIKKIWKSPKSELKPNTIGYLKVMEEFKVEADNCYVIGDSISKDVNPAISIGAKGIWAKYGEEVIKKNLDTILSITHWDKSKVENIYVQKHDAPEYVVNSFIELKSIIKSSQFEFDF